MNTNLSRRRISSGSRFEREIGYSRAVVEGDDIWVSGTTGFDYATMTLAGGVAAQCEQALRNVEAALAEAGFALSDTVRVRYILADRADWPACWPILASRFGDVRPAATMIVAGLVEERVKFEIEVDARRGRS